MRVRRSIVTAAHVVFARPDNFHRRAAQSPGNDCRFTLDVRIDDRAAAKTATGKLSMESNLLGFRPSTSR